MTALEFIYNQDLDAEKIHDYAYRFRYLSVPCLGLPTRTTNNGEVLWETMVIRPVDSRMDIGYGAGESQTIKFW